MTTQQYHLFYNENELKRDSILRIRRLIKEQKFFKQTKENKLILLKELSKDLSLIYGVDNINNILIQNIFNITDCYLISSKVIILSKPSLVTFLHEFKHHLNRELNLDNTEDSARGFSHSLYYLSTPKLFKSSVEKGLIVYQKSII